MKAAGSKGHVGAQYYLVATLQELNVEQADIDTVIGAVAPLKDDIVLTLFQRWLKAA